MLNFTEYRGIGSCNLFCGKRFRLRFFGLSGFLFDSDENDHHVKWIKTGLFKDSCGPVLIVHYADKNGNDGYSWEMNLQSLSPGITVHRFLPGNQIGSGSGNEKIDLPYGEGIPVLVDFELSVDQGDHHLDQAGMRLTLGSPGNVTLWFNDKTMMTRLIGQ